MSSEEAFGSVMGSDRGRAWYWYPLAEPDGPGDLKPGAGSSHSTRRFATPRLAAIAIVNADGRPNTVAERDAIEADLLRDGGR